jgi:hypothetical protein
MHWVIPKAGAKHDLLFNKPTSAGMFDNAQLSYVFKLKG